MSMPFPIRPLFAALSLLTCSVIAAPAAVAQPVSLYAAGSLRAALDEASKTGRSVAPLNALLAKRDFPDLVSVQIPPELAAGAQYGLTVMRGAPEPAWRLAWFILSDDGQAILAKHAFGSVR